ncbi:hypothetical protein Mapa_015023 [Marchantia paleacea]|nr:hypothetical protein Mapa_015023 [Marchantia paleacea]
MGEEWNKASCRTWLRPSKTVSHSLESNLVSRVCNKQAESGVGRISRTDIASSRYSNHVIGNRLSAKTHNTLEAIRRSNTSSTTLPGTDPLSVTAFSIAGLNGKPGCLVKVFFRH